MAKINVEPWLNFSNTNGRGVCLRPNLEPIEVKPNYTYDGNGHLDFDIFLSSLEKAAQEHWGFRPALAAKAQHDSKFMSQIKEAIVDRAIRVIPNILEMFDPVEDSLQGEGEAFRLTLMMHGSGMLVSIPVRGAVGGGYEVGAVIEALEGSYQRVLAMDSGADIFSGTQRSDLRTNIPTWLDGIMGEMGICQPSVLVDTEHVELDGDAFHFGVSITPQKGGETSGPRKEYRLSIPIAENGAADYSGTEALAGKIAGEWVQDHAGASHDAVNQLVQEHLLEVVTAYVPWVIAEQQKDVQKFWDAFNGELKKKLEEATKLEKKVEEVRAKLKKNAAELEINTTSSVAPGVIEGLCFAAATLWRELPGSMVEIAEGVSKLPGNMHKELSGSAAEIVKGLEFGFLAAGWTVLEAAWVVLRDVAAIAGPGIVIKIAQQVAKSVKVGHILYRFARPVANPSAKARIRIAIGEQIASGALSVGNVIDFWFSAKDTAERISDINLKIKRMIYGDNK